LRGIREIQTLQRHFNSQKEEIRKNCQGNLLTYSVWSKMNWARDIKVKDSYSTSIPDKRYQILKRRTFSKDH